MKTNYDFSEAKRGAVIPATGNKERITIRLDQDVVGWFREKVEKQGGGSYQSMINEALKEHIGSKDERLEGLLRKVLREELERAS